MPVFDWPAHAAEGFAWWLARLERELELFDLIRIDHFRGLVKFWQLPLDELDPTKGSWGEGPGMAFFDAIRERFGGLPLILEDLGYITPDVIELREELGVPGHERRRPRRRHRLAHRLRPLHVDPRLGHAHGLVESVGPGEPATARRRCDSRQPASTGPSSSTCSPTDNELVVIPAQDLLGLGSEARMNRPGTVDPRNWDWKLEGPLSRRAGGVAGRADRCCGTPPPPDRRADAPATDGAVCPSGRSARQRRSRLDEIGPPHAREARSPRDAIGVVRRSAIVFGARNLGKP